MPLAGGAQIFVDKPTNADAAAALYGNFAGMSAPMGSGPVVTTVGGSSSNSNITVVQKAPAGASDSLTIAQRRGMRGRFSLSH